MEQDSLIITNQFTWCRCLTWLIHTWRHLTFASGSHIKWYPFLRSLPVYLNIMEIMSARPFTCHHQVWEVWIPADVHFDLMQHLQYSHQMKCMETSEHCVNVLLSIWEFFLCWLVTWICMLQLAHSSLGSWVSIDLHTFKSWSWWMTTGALCGTKQLILGWFPLFLMLWQLSYSCWDPRCFVKSRQTPPSFLVIRDCLGFILNHILFLMCLMCDLSLPVYLGVYYTSILYTWLLWKFPYMGTLFVYMCGMTLTECVPPPPPPSVYTVYYVTCICVIVPPFWAFVFSFKALQSVYG